MRERERYIQHMLPALIALVALANEMHLLLNQDKYIAGIWQQYLLRRIMWQPSDAVDESPGQSKPVIRMSSYHAPA